MAAKNGYSKTVVGHRRPAPKAVAGGPEDPANFAAGIESLFALVSMMRTMNAEPAGSPLNPKVVLSGTGVEIRFAGQNGLVESVPAEVQASGEQLLRIDRALKALNLRVARAEQKEQNGGSEEWFARVEKELREIRQAQTRLEAALERNTTEHRGTERRGGNAAGFSAADRGNDGDPGGLHEHDGRPGRRRPRPRTGHPCRHPGVIAPGPRGPASEDHSLTARLELRVAPQRALHRNRPVRTDTSARTESAAAPPKSA